MNLDYWGNYKGYKIYKFYGKGPRTMSKVSDMEDKVLAADGVLYYRGEVIGNVNDAGQVSNWNPDKWFHEKLDEETTWKPVPKKKSKSESEPEPVKKDVDATIRLAMKRSVEDMVGERLGTYKDNG